MRIFNGIPFDNGLDTLKQGIAAILDRAQEYRLLSRKWSLAELQLDAEEYAWLCDWAIHLSGKSVQA